jgi:hypothetical protein
MATVEGGLDRMDALERLRQHLGCSNHQHGLQRRKHEDDRDQHRLEEIERVPLVAPLELQRREAGGGQQHHEGDDDRPGRRTRRSGRRRGQQPTDDTSGGEGGGDQQHGHGKGAL